MSGQRRDLLLRHETSVGRLVLIPDSMDLLPVSPSCFMSVTTSIFDHGPMLPRVTGS